MQIGGLVKAQVNLANALARRGHAVTIKTYDGGGPLVDSLDERVSYVNVQRKRFEIAYRIKGAWRLFNYENWIKYSSPRQLYHYYVDEQYDIEIAFFRGLSVKIISGSTNASALKIAWVHSDFKHCGGITNSFTSLNAAKRAYRRFDRIIGVSRQASESFSQVMGIKDTVTAIYNLCPANAIKVASEELPVIKKAYDFQIVAVGLLVSPKGFDRLLEACKRLTDNRFTFGLWIIGEGAERGTLEAYIREYQLTNVTLLGLQNNPYKYLKSADLLVCSSRFEGYCLVIAEALILQVPVVSTRCTGPSEILADGEYGLLVENSTAGIYDGVQRMMSDRVLYQHYKAKTQERAPFFDEVVILDQIEALFRQ